jgi:predicted transcriptional regulator
MKPKSKLLTIKIQPDLLETFTDFADSRNMKRGTMIKSIVSEFIAKQNNQVA